MIRSFKGKILRGCKIQKRLIVLLAVRRFFTVSYPHNHSIKTEHVLIVYLFKMLIINKLFFGMTLQEILRGSLQYIIYHSHKRVRCMCHLKRIGHFQSIRYVEFTQAANTAIASEILSTSIINSSKGAFCKVTTRVLSLSTTSQNIFLPFLINVPACTK
jgi:hypothetical protein